MKRILLLVSVLIALAGPAAAGAILNTLQLTAPDRTGWSGAFEGMMRSSGGNTELFQAEAGGRILWRGERSLVRLMTAAAYQENSGNETERNVTAHLRHNRRLGRRLQSVAFVQVQHNPFQRLASRSLMGGGLRWDVSAAPGRTLAIGATPMLEIERIQDRSGHLARGRLSTFVIASWTLREGIVLEGSGVYQPLFSDFGRVRAVGNLGLRIALSGSLSLKTGAAIEHNSEPPAGVDPTDWSTYTGLGWEF